MVFTGLAPQQRGQNTCGQNFRIKFLSKNQNPLRTISKPFNVIAAQP
jgi:hypothetical protein